MKSNYLFSLFLLLFFAFAGNAQVSPEYPPNKTIDTTEQLYAVAALRVKPEYTGGMDAFYKFIGTSFHVPDVDVEDDIKAKIFTSFIIEKDGTVSDIKILKDPGYGLGDEAGRIIALTSGKWSPGMQNEKPVRVMYSLPLVIMLEGTGPKEKPKENQDDDKK